MHNIFRTAIILALTIMTQVASSQWVGQFDESSQENAIRPDPRPPRYPRDPRNPRERLVYVSVGEARTRKVVDNAFVFRPRLNDRAYQIRLVGTAEGVVIRSVLVEFNNGDRRQFRELEGRLREGQRVSSRINGRYVRKITVVATSESLTGSRGRFRVDLAVYR